MNLPVFLRYYDNWAQSRCLFYQPNKADSQQLVDFPPWLLPHSLGSSSNTFGLLVSCPYWGESGDGTISGPTPSYPRTTRQIHLYIPLNSFSNLTITSFSSCCISFATFTSHGSVIRLRLTSSIVHAFTLSWRFPAILWNWGEWASRWCATCAHV